ncbi:MAG TPA: winged helix DNA-binding domain-containing protein [Streptosporangiaceae bacterium]
MTVPAGPALSPLAAERLRAQLLLGPPARSVTAVTGHLLAVQAQDPRGARLAVRARTSGLVAADVDRALTDDRSVVVSWLNRGTLHLVLAEDYWWLHQLITPQLLTGIKRRLAQEGVTADDAERGVRVIEESLAADGPLTRPQLRDRVAAAGVRTLGQAIVYIFALATFHGLIVRGPMHGREQAFVLVRDWLGAPPKPVDRDQALAMLAHRYLAGHGPAAEKDLAKWAGLPLGDARRGLAAIAPKLADRDDGLASLAPPGGEPPVPPVRLLGAFDPLLLGWASRDLFLATEGPIITSNGLFRPFVLRHGRGSALWAITRGQVVTDPLGPLTAPEQAALAAEVTDVTRFLGGGPASRRAGRASSGSRTAARSR